MKARRARGFIIADALVSVALAAMTATLAITLLIWTTRALDQAQTRIGAARVMERLYEEARLASRGDLAGTHEGVIGRYHWRRTGLGTGARAFGYGPERVRLEVRWSTAMRGNRDVVEALIIPGSAS